MKRIGIVLLAGLALGSLLVLAGCGGKEEEASVTCSSCEMVIAQTLAKQVDGEWMCQVCAAKAEATEATETAMVACAGGCGMEGSQTDFTLVDGKYYCAGCLAGIDHGQAAVGQDEKPPPGAEAH